MPTIDHGRDNPCPTETMLVTGAGGLLGGTLITEAASRGHNVVAAYHSSLPENPPVKSVILDVTDTAIFEDLLTSHDISYVINCAAMTDVDECERRQSAAERVNAIAPGEMAALCAEYGVGFCQISTDYVFSDTKTHPIPETTRPDPIQAYGETKFRGEALVRHRHDNPLIPRVSFLFGVRRIDDTLVGLPAWILDRLRNRKTVSLYTDQMISPTVARHAATTILRLLEAGHTGVYHCSNDGCTTPYEFGWHLMQKYLDEREQAIEPAKLTDVNREAPRPTRVCLDVRKVERELDRLQQTWREGLDAISNRFRLK